MDIDDVAERDHRMDLDPTTSGQPIDLDQLAMDAHPMDLDRPEQIQPRSRGFKRKASDLRNNNGDSPTDGDIIMLGATVEGQPISPPTTPHGRPQATQTTKVVIDLTGSDDDDDIMIIDPPAAELSDQPRVQRLKITPTTWTQTSDQPQARQGA
jgi:hypothetical protein